jgi:hypothetical protein
LQSQGTGPVNKGEERHVVQITALIDGAVFLSFLALLPFLTSSFAHNHWLNPCLLSVSMVCLFSGIYFLQQAEPQLGGGRKSTADRGLGILAILYALFWWLIWAVTGPEPAPKGGPYHQFLYLTPQPPVVTVANLLFFLALAGFVGLCRRPWRPSTLKGTTTHFKVVTVGLFLIDIAMCIQFAVVKGIRSISSPQLGTTEDQIVVFFGVFFLLMIVYAPPRLAVMRITGRWSLATYLAGLALLTWRVWILNV